MLYIVEIMHKWGFECGCWLQIRIQIHLANITLCLYSVLKHKWKS